MVHLLPDVGSSGNLQQKVFRLHGRNLPIAKMEK